MSGGVPLIPVSFLRHYAPYIALEPAYAELAEQHADLLLEHEALTLRYRFLEELFKQTLRRVVKAEELIDQMTGRTAWPEPGS